MDSPTPIPTAEADRRQGAIFAIAALANSQRALQETLEEIHRLVSALLPGAQLLLALREPDSSAVRAVVATPSPHVQGIGPDPDEVALTFARQLVREPVAFRGDGHQFSRRHPGLLPLGMEDSHWLAVPIPGEEGPAGALVLYGGEQLAGFSSLDQGLLEFVAGQVQVALRLRAEEEAEVVAPAAELMQELIDHQRSERLQAALFSIGELANGSASGERFYAAVHDIIGDVLDSRNLSVAQLSADGRFLEYPYYVDDRDVCRVSMLKS